MFIYNFIDTSRRLNHGLANQPLAFPVFLHNNIKLEYVGTAMYRCWVNDHISLIWIVRPTIGMMSRILTMIPVCLNLCRGGSLRCQGVRFPNISKFHWENLRWMEEIQLIPHLIRLVRSTKGLQRAGSLWICLLCSRLKRPVRKYFKTSNNNLPSGYD